VPVAVHPEVRVQHAAVVEHEVLVLAEALHRGHAAADELRGDRVGQGAPRHGVMRAHHDEAPADHGGPEAADRGLDFGELGHGERCDDACSAARRKSVARPGRRPRLRAPPAVVPAMARQQSLKHEYEVYVERAIEEFKDSVPRSHLLSLGDEAVAALNAEAQTTLTEMVLWEEVDRIIARRLQLPSYATWRRRRLRRLAELRRPERWGLAPDGVLACALRDAAGEHVLFASADADEATLFSAALGCNVTALTLEPSALDRMFAEADEAGIGAQVRGCVCALGGWEPDVPLRAVVCAGDAFDAVAEGRARHGGRRAAAGHPRGGRAPAAWTPEPAGDRDVRRVARVVQRLGGHHRVDLRPAGALHHVRGAAGGRPRRLGPGPRSSSQATAEPEARCPTSGARSRRSPGAAPPTGSFRGAGGTVR
jgi:hypothetical protein